MLLSRDVALTRLSFPVRPLEGVKVDVSFLLNISGTLQVRRSEIFTTNAPRGNATHFHCLNSFRLYQFRFKYNLG